MSRLPFLFVAMALLLGQTRPVHGYALEAHHWPVGTSANPTVITMNLQLSSNDYAYPLQASLNYAPGLQDGSASWNAVAEAALGEWNQYLLGARFVYNTNTASAPALDDGVNSVLFSSTALGQDFGADAIAVTLRYYNPSTNYTTEADVVVNTAYYWDSYRGALQYRGYGIYEDDLRRVLDHEFGHVLGLDHPDLATPPQTVNAIMNSVISDLDHIELDDIQGVMSIYGQKTVLEPVIVAANPPEGGTVTGNGSFALGSTQTLTATAAPGYVFTQWEDGSTNPTRVITVPLENATYTATFTQALDVWTLSSSAASGPLSGFYSLLFVNGSFMAFAPNGMSTSTDGVTWVSHLPATTQTYNCVAVTYGNGLFISVGGSGEIWSSPDGINWTDRSPVTTGGTFQAVAYGNGIYVATGTPLSTGDPALIASSTDGIHWTQSTRGVTDFTELTSVVYANGIFVAVGTGEFGAESFASYDGVNWTTTNVSAVTSSAIQSFSSVTYGQGLFVAGVNNGYVATSPDGVNWTVTAYAYFTTISLAYGNGMFLAWGYVQFLTSPDAVTWLTRSLVDNSYHNQFVYGNGRIVGTGQNGISYSAPLVVAPSAVLPVVTSALTSHGSANLTFNYQVVASHTPLAFNATGLPPGLAINPQTGLISGTPTASGTFPVKLFATNDAGSGTAMLSLVVAAPATPQTYADWVHANSVTGQPTDTPEGDSVPNLMKYFYDIAPGTTMTAADRAALPVLATASGGTVLTLTFRENKSLENTGVTVESSTDLKTWGTPTGATITQTGVTDPNTGDPMMQAQVPVTAGEQFIRLVVTPQ